MPDRGRPGEGRPDSGAASVWLWDALFVGTAALSAVLVALAAEPAPARAAAGALVLGTGAAWLVAGRRLGLAGVRDGRPAVLAYVALLIGLLVGAVVLVPAAMWAVFVVSPQLFWLLERAWAVAGTVVLAPGLVLLAALRAGASPGEVVREELPITLFLTAFGVLVGVWIQRVTRESDERARLIDELQSSRAEVAELSRRAGVAAERERLAGEIHDTLAQGFTSIVTLLQAAQPELDTDPSSARRHVDLAVRAARDNLRTARELVAATAPAALAADTLSGAIARAAARCAEETGLSVRATVEGEPRRLPAEQEIVLLRAAQELLGNAARHARARTVEVRLAFGSEETATLRVDDDGVGFDPGGVPAGRYGLAMMRGRVERLGGSLAVDGAPGRGTRVSVTVPA
jgi:signal transduction histidine kinase